MKKIKLRGIKNNCSNSFNFHFLLITFNYFIKFLLVFGSIIILPFFVIADQEDKRTVCPFTSGYLNTPSKMSILSQRTHNVREILLKHQPRIFIDPDSYYPIDFYKDYLPNCHILKKSRIELDNKPSKKFLKKIKHNSTYHLDFKIPSKKIIGRRYFNSKPKIYGRVYLSPSIDKYGIPSLLFLKYSLVFPYSGLPKKIGFLKTAGSSIIGETKAWHELDIHGAIHIVLHAKTKKPLGLLIAQHNHHKSYVLGTNISEKELKSPVFAISTNSNEPYLIKESQSSFYKTTVGSPFNIDHIFSNRFFTPISSGKDYIKTLHNGAIEINLTLEILKKDDPLYTASISLGDKKKILGLIPSFFQSGPPGIDFYTFPQLKNLTDLWAFWNINTDDKWFFKEISKESDWYSFKPQSYLKKQIPKLARQLKKSL